MKAWRVARFGRPSESMTIGEIEAPTPGPGEVLIQVSSATLNYNDIDIIHGRYPSARLAPPFTPGMEVLGQVQAYGLGAERWAGKRVAAITKGIMGGFAEAALAPMSMVFEMPAAMPEPAAAAVLMPFHLAWFGLHERGRLRAGETLLVHGGAGGIGSAAVQIGVQAGARVIATAGSPAKVAFCRELGAEVAIDYRAADFTDAVLQATGGQGVDVAFDVVGGDITEATFRCMAFNGRLLLAGFASNAAAQDRGMVPRPIIFGNFSLSGVCLAYVDDPDQAKLARGYNCVPHSLGEKIHADVLALMQRGALRPLVGLDVPFEELPSALEALEQRETTGRVVICAGARRP